MLNKKQIEDSAYFALRKAQIEALKTERLGIIHVSDLIKPCMRYVTYNKLSSGLAGTTEDIKSLYYGQIVHAHSMLAPPERHEMFLAYNYVEDKPLTRDEALQMSQDDPRQLDIIYGSIDDVIEVEGEMVICDKKTTGSIEKLKRFDARPYDQHKLQINMYRVLLEKCYGIDSKWGCVVYIPNAITEERDTPVPLSFRLSPSEETLEFMKSQALIIKDAMSNYVLPGRTRNFLCDGMCPHAVKCFTDERKSWKTE